MIAKHLIKYLCNLYVLIPVTMKLVEFDLHRIPRGHVEEAVMLWI
jgi:hypothetical protein